MVDQKNQTRPGERNAGERATHETGAAASARDLAENAASRLRHTAEGVKEKVAHSYDEASEWAEDTYETAGDWAADRYAEGAQRFNKLRRRARRSTRHVSGGVQEYVAENPMVVGLVGLAAGLLIGALLPRTRRENEAFGEWADELRHQGVRYAREATQKGRELVEETFEGDDPRFSKHESEFQSRDAAKRR